MSGDRKVIICGLVFLSHEKEPYVASGMSLQGAQEYDSREGTLRCHECGEWFALLSTHARRAHGISAKEYKAKHGLWARSKLVSPELSAKFTGIASKRWGNKKGMSRVRFGREVPASKAVSESWSEKARESRKATSIARRNLVARCPAQLAARIAAVAADLGRTPKFKELSERGIHNVRRAALHQGISTRELVSAIGLEPNRWGGHSERKYSEAVLIELLRDFYVLNGRTPGKTDWCTGILPSASVFGSYFGSLPAAYEAAGLSKVANKRTRLQTGQVAHPLEQNRGVAISR